MPLPDPNTWSNFDLSASKDQKIFQHQLITVITALLNPGFVAGQLNGMGLINYSGLNTLATQTVMAGNLTFNCNNAAMVSILLNQLTGSGTLTLNNLGPGVPVQITISSNGAHTFKMAATLPGGTAYPSMDYFTGGGIVDLIGTGLATPAGSSFRILIGITVNNGVILFAYV